MQLIRAGANVLAFVAAITVAFTFVALILDFTGMADMGPARYLILLLVLFWLGAAAFRRLGGFYLATENPVGTDQSGEVVTTRRTQRIFDALLLVDTLILFPRLLVGWLAR